MDSDPTSNHRLLDTWINERRRELRIRTLTELANRAGMSDENLRKIRRGEISVTDNAADGLEEALRWEPGSVQRAVLKGIKPTPRPGSDAAPMPSSRGDNWTEDPAYYERLRRFAREQGVEPTHEVIAAMAAELARLRAMQRAVRKPKPATESEPVGDNRK